MEGTTPTNDSEELGVSDSRSQITDTNSPKRLPHKFTHAAIAPKNGAMRLVA